VICCLSAEMSAIVVSPDRANRFSNRIWIEAQYTVAQPPFEQFSGLKPDQK
jgi:hypothetical protein